ATTFEPRGEGVLDPRVFFRARGNPFVLQHEAEHIVQATDPVFAERIGQLPISVGVWAQMSSAARLRQMHTVLELELDSQERLLARAQAAGDVEAMDDLFAEMEDVSVRMRDVDRALAEPGSGPPAWFDPSRAPTYLFGGPRLPR